RCPSSPWRACCNGPASAAASPLSLHDALPISMGEDSRGRRSAQSAMYRIAEAFVRWIAPILAFTADEMWQHMPEATDTGARPDKDRKSTRLNSSHVKISYAVFCLKKKRARHRP